MHFEWEKIEFTNDNVRSHLMSRAKVNGGWIVKSRSWVEGDNNSHSESMTFLPDRFYKWKTHFIDMQPDAGTKTFWYVMIGVLYFFIGSALFWTIKKYF